MRLWLVPLAFIALVLLLCVVVVVAAHRSHHGYSEREYDNVAFVEYGKRAKDGSISWYPSQAAYQNDPCWGRGGWTTVARNRTRTTILSEPRRVYVRDIKALRGED